MTSSIEDVAKLAGVSIATVSRSLRGLPDVAPATRDRVLTAARELNYVASPFAARLASGRTATVGVVVPFVNRWFFAEILGAVEAVLHDRGFDLLLYNLGDTAGRDRFFNTMPVRKRVDALVVASLVLTESETDALLALGIPIGLLGVGSPRFHSVRIDDADAASLAVQHLIDLGHRRIGLIGGDTDDPMRFTPPHHRRQGYIDVLRKAGIDYEPELEVLGYFTVDGGEAATKELLARPNRPTALFAESDEMAWGALRALRRAGLRVPQDVAVVGFDEHPVAELFDLTTIAQPVVEQATILTSELLQLMPDLSARPHEEVLPTRLIVRGSTDPSRSVM
ncbi:MAG: LacI family DNA-binding transcriptional regulator [Actinobacteria bacterium]|nr:LacI family DNA-binding transcriptional regulator [Actinomycetota bacterium]